MRWQGRRQSRNVQDRRRAVPGRAVGGGVLVIVIALAVWALGGNPMAVLQLMSQSGAPGAAAPTSTPIPADDARAQFVSVVLADTEEVWGELFRQAGATYREPTLVLFRDQVRSACGFSSAASGPFYCPGDEQVYIDLRFFDELSERFGAPGDFAQAYVVAHEVGHHVQRLLGITDRVDRMRGRVDEATLNEMSVRLELQADFLAGVWAHHADQAWDILEPGDIEEALRAAAAIGDDRLQMESRGTVVPESFTHGTSAQRMRWFKRGLETGDMDAGDTFSAEDL